MVFHSSLVASGLIPPQLRMELVLPWRLRSYAEEGGRLSCMCMFMFMFMCIFISSIEAAVTEAAADEAEMMDELLALVAVAVVIVVAAVVVVLTGMMDVSWPISRSSLKVDH